MIKTIALALLFSVAGYSQTKTNISQITATAPQNTVWVVVPGVGYIPALIGPNLTLVNTGGVYTLNSVLPPPSTPVFKTQNTKAGATPSQSYSTTQAVSAKANLEVFRNGLLQTEFEDYTAVVNADNTITVNFVGNAIQSGDLVVLRYY